MTSGKAPGKVGPALFDKTWEMGHHFMRFQRNDALVLEKDTPES